MTSVNRQKLTKFVMNKTTQKVARWFNLIGVGTFMALSVMQTADAVIFDAARTSMAADLAASGWTQGANAFNLVFGLVEALLLIIPVASGIVALTRLERGAEGWMPWVSVMGGSIVFIGFTSFLTAQIFA